MKRVFALLLMITALLTLLPACGDDEIPDGPAELWVVTEYTDGAMMNDQIKMLIDEFEESHENVTIRLDILPSEAENRALYLDALHGRIMSGDGPDIYLMPTAGQPDSISNPNSIKEPLFRDPTLQMYNGIFADISKYYDADDTLGKEYLNQTVMDAGLLGEYRYILPLRFDFAVILADRALAADYGIDVDTLEGRVDELMDLAIQLSDDANAGNGLSFTPTYDWFSDFIDYENVDIRLEQADLSEMMEKNKTLWSARGASPSDVYSICDLYTYISRADYFAEQGYPFCTTTLANIIELSALLKAEEEDVEVIPLRSTDGSLIAEVTYYGAVGSGCQYPELAYEFLRMFLLEKAQWEQYNPRDFNMNIRGLVEDGYPVRVTGSVEAFYKNLRGRLEVAELRQLRISKIPNHRRQKLISETFTLDDTDIPILAEPINVVRFPIIMEYEDSVHYYFATMEEPAQAEESARQAIDDLKIYLYEG